ncbi:MAG: SPFH domain-containing protein, partial [Candidatus Nanoarchaeia archaeon]
PGQKGIWRRVLGPGRYRINPVGYKVDFENAVNVPIGYVGVMTSLAGKQAAEGKFAGPGEKGVREDVLQPGLYYINPREIAVNVLEIGVNQVSLLGKQGTTVLTKGQIKTENVAMDELQQNVLMEQKEKRADYLMSRAASVQQQKMEITPVEGAKRAPKPALRKAEQKSEDISNVFVLDQFVEFPSKDGFEISLDMTVEFELLPKNIAWIYKSYGDLPAVVDKIIMPQILSVSRMKGSAYGAKDFIVGEGREKFQNDLTETLDRVLNERKIKVHGALIRHVNVPMQILDPIQQASLAIETDLTNKEKQNTAKKQAELNTELSMIQQRGEQVAQETEKIKAEIQAEQEKQVAEINADTLKQTALIEKTIAEIKAEKTKRMGKAEADAFKLVEGERAIGSQLKVKAFNDPMAYNLWTFANTLNPEVKIRVVHAGDGTLWTDLDKTQFGNVGGAKLLQEKK